MGAKPLYQGVASGLAVVSTEPSVIRSLSAEPEPVPPGYIVRLRGGCLRLAKYGCGLVAEPFRGSIDQAADEVGRLLKSSLMLRLKGVKSLGIAFSGGLDSSLLAVFLSKRHHVVLFSVFVEGSRDSSSAVRAADELGLDPVVGLLDGHRAERLPDRVGARYHLVGHDEGERGGKR